MSRKWISLVLALCLLLPITNVNADGSSDEYFYEINGEQIDTDGDNFFDKFRISYDPDTSVEEFVDVDVEFDVYDSETGSHLGHAVNQHHVFNGDEEVYHINWTADYQSEYDFYVALYDGDNLEDEHWFNDIPLRAPGEEEEDEFVCDNGNTIPMSYVDDGDNDCGDWSDEPNHSDDDGGAHEFKCANGDTIPIEWVNNGYDDCEFGSDELLGDGFADMWFQGVSVSTIDNVGDGNRDTIWIDYDVDGNRSVEESPLAFMIYLWVYDSYTNSLVGEVMDYVPTYNSSEEDWLAINWTTEDESGVYDIVLGLITLGSDLDDVAYHYGIIIGEDDMQFACDNGNTIPASWVDDGWCDCEDSSDEPDGFDCGDNGGEEDDEMGFGLPTGQLGSLISPEGDGANQELSINFITPHMAEVEVASSLSLDADTANTLREDIILASILGEVDSYFAEGKTAINAAYAAGEADGEETILAYMSLYENATLSAVPDYTVDDNEPSFDFVFNTAENIGPFVEFDDVIITQQHLDTYYDVAWGDGMNNILAMDLTLTFTVFLGFIAAFSGEEIDEDELNATFEALLLGSMTTCPEAPSGFAVMGCVMEEYSQASVELLGDSEMSMVDDYDEEDIMAYCFDNANLILTDADTTIDGGNCIDSVEVFYNMSEDEGGPSMDGVASVSGVGLSDQPGGFPLFWPEVTMSIVDTENVLGQFSDNVDKPTTVVSGMKFTAFFPGVSAGDSHTFIIEPEDDEFFANVSTLQVSPPSGYVFGEGSIGDVVTLTGSEEAMTWTFVKSGETDTLDDSGLPSPGLLLVVLTIFGVASLRRRF